MSGEIRIGMVGLDTSHSVAFTKCLQAPDVAADQKVGGARVVSCMRFETPFQDKNGLDGRQKQMEEWGVAVTEDFDEAVAECEAIMLEINDPAYHLEYFRKCVPLGKPIFLDKPMADNTTNARAIYKLAKENNLRVFSSSSLRFVPGLIESCKAIPKADYAYTYGALGKAPAGSSVVWYGVHAFEMLERAMGQGAIGVFARRDKAGVVCTIEYPDNRRGIVELTEGSSAYGGCLRDKGKAAPYVCDNSRLYPDQLVKVIEFFNGAEPAASLEDALEVTAMLDAAERSTQSGKPEAL